MCRLLFRLFPSVLLALVLTASAHADRVLVGFRGAPDANAVRRAGGRVINTFWIVPVVAADLPAQAVAGLQNNPNVAYIESDRTLYAVGYLPGETVPWGIDRVKAPLVFNLGYTGLGASVAVLDTGIDYTHTDLAPPRYAGGYDFVNGDNDPMDDNGHGTHVSGTIAASNNGSGVVGVGPDISIYAFKFLDASGSGSTSNEILAIQAAVGAGVGVMSMSYGSSFSNTSEKNALQQAANAGIVLVAAAGNGGNNPRLSYPAGYDTVISVAATDSSNQRASFSSSNSKVELAAPGVSVVSDKLGGGTIAYSGTSMATPHVAGAAAVLRARGWSAGKVRNALDNTATDLGSPGRDKYYGYGLVNLQAALGYTGP